MVRLHAPFLTELDAWITQQNERLSRPEAIRRLAEQALAGNQRKRR
jgi:hypothetical protein